MIHYLKKYLECRYNLARLRLQFTALKSDKLIKDFNLCFESAKSEFTVAYYILADRELLSGMMIGPNIIKRFENNIPTLVRNQKSDDEHEFT